MRNRLLTILLTGAVLATAACQTGVAPPASADKPAIGGIGSIGSNAP